MSETWNPVGIDYCREHHGIRNEDETEKWCDWRDNHGNECETCEGTGAAEDDDPGGGTFDCADCDAEGFTVCTLVPLGWIDAR